MKYILVVFGVLISISLIGQSKSRKKSKFKEPSPTQLLAQAKDLAKSSPTQSIRIIEELLSVKRDKEISNLLDEAYFLLGNIYEEIDQNELARQRYVEALSYTSEKDGDQKALIYYRIGKLALAQKNAILAYGSFNKCLDFSSSPKQIYQCETGKIDVNILNNQNEIALKELAKLQETNSLDSLSLIQIETRRSQVYSQMNDFENAALSIQQVYNTIPKQAVLLDDDMEQVSKSQNKIYEIKDLSNAKKIEIQNSIKYKDKNFRGNIARENFRLSEVYEDENDIDGVINALDVSKKYIDESAEPNLIADVYKKSYEYNLKQGKANDAFNDLEKYVAAK